MKKIEEKTDKAAREYAMSLNECGMYDKATPATEEDMAYAFKAGAKFALSQQWRSTKDEKPNGNEKMLYILRDGSLSIGYFVNDDYQRFWMPIPPLPEK